MLIGVLGTTGCGKSTLINAILDEETIVPTNAMRASTSVVTEISWNSSNDSSQSYRAEIEFISTEEWKAEINVLLSDLASTASRGNISMKSIKSGTEANIAYAKISAVYPQIELSRLATITTESLLAENDLSRILGNTREVCAQNARNFSAAIATYIDSNNKRSNASMMTYWPLVRCVRVYTKAEVLRDGLVLVDLPGLGDSNAGRKQVAELYMRKLTHIWIVADIVRALDDQIAKDLLGTSFRRQLLMDGKYDNSHVTFVLSKTDIINTEEVIDSLILAESSLKSQLQQEVVVTAEIRSIQNSISVEMTTLGNLNRKSQELDEEFKAMKPSPDKAHQQITTRTRAKRKRNEVDEEAASKEITKWTKAQERKDLINDKTKHEKAIKRLNELLSTLKKTQKIIRSEIQNVCTQARNDYTKDQLRIDFEDGLREMKEDILHVDETGGSLSKARVAIDGMYPHSCGSFTVD